MLLALLGHAADVRAADYTWALRCALSFLEPLDAARLVVALLESGGHDARARVHWLHFGDAPLPPMDEHTLLGEAASHACWRALVMLLEDLRAKSPPWVTLHDDMIAEVDDLKSDEIVQRATMAHRGTHYRFGRDVVKDAAARGHIQAVKWLLPRSTSVSGHVETTRREKDHRLEDFSRTEGILEAAARARQLHIVTWMVETSPFVRCILPYDDELEAVCWAMSNAPGSRGFSYFCATTRYGFSRAYASDYTSARSTATFRVTEMPLADAFARDGDLATLQKMRARANYQRLIGSNAIALAAEHGHLGVVKWLYDVLAGSVGPAGFIGAARGGHLSILEWIHGECGFKLLPSAIIEAARYGHIDVLRWCRSIDATQKPHFDGVALAYAIENGHTDVVTFLHNECKTPMAAHFLFDPLTKCPSIETFDYVLNTFALQPPLLRALLKRVVRGSCLTVVRHLVLNRGLWNRDAFSAAVAHNDPDAALQISQFLYTQAQERARHLQTPLHDQIDFTSLTFKSVWHVSVAEWLLKSVPDVLLSDHYHASVNDAYVTEHSWRPILIACIKYRPDECRGLSWFPEWAVRVNSFDALELLEQCCHPRLRDVNTFQSVTMHTRDARFMLKLLPLPDGEPKLRQEVTEWAAVYGMATVLDRVLENEEPDMQRQLLKRVAHHVGVSGHIDMAEWLLRKLSTLELSSTTMLKNTSSNAVCHGHTHVLEWLRDHQLMPTRPQAIESLVVAAGNARRVRSLKWILSKKPRVIPPKWIARVLVNAVRQDHAEIVEFITRTFEPDDLPVGDLDVRRIRLYLQKRRRSNEGAAASITLRSAEDKETPDLRQSKRLRR